MPYIPESGKQYPNDQLDREFRNIAVNLADYDQFKINARTYFPLKAAAVKLSGTSLTPTNDFNVVAVTNPVLGTYRVQVDQTTFFGQAWGPVAYAAVTGSYSAPTLSVSENFLPFDADQFDIVLTEFYLQGQNMRTQPYNLKAGDTLSVMLLLNLVDPAAEGIPA